MGIGAAVSSGAMAAGGAVQEGAPRFPFAPVTVDQWTTITADGFSEPVPGYVYDGSELRSGLPLGGLGTGYFTLEGHHDTLPIISTFPNA
jgi:hypothetical protein